MADFRAGKIVRLISVRGIDLLRVINLLEESFGLRGNEVVRGFGNPLRECARMLEPVHTQQDDGEVERVARLARHGFHSSIGCVQRFVQTCRIADVESCERVPRGSQFRLEGHCFFERCLRFVHVLLLRSARNRSIPS